MRKAKTNELDPISFKAIQLDITDRYLLDLLDNHAKYVGEERVRVVAEYNFPTSGRKRMKIHCTVPSGRRRNIQYI